MKQNLTYAEACEKHPNEVAEIITAMRKGRSKFKGTDPSTWLWSYDWGCRAVRVTGTDLEARIRARLATADGLVSLGAQPVSRGSREWAKVSVEVLRPWATEIETKALAEEARYANMTEDERRAEIREALGFLTGPKNSGFKIRVGADYDPENPKNRTADIEWGNVEGPIKVKGWIYGKGEHVLATHARDEAGFKEALALARAHLEG